MNLEGKGYSEPRLQHCTPAWAIERDSISKIKERKRKEEGMKGKEGRKRKEGGGRKEGREEGREKGRKEGREGGNNNNNSIHRNTTQHK